MSLNVSAVFLLQKTHKIDNVLEIQLYAFACWFTPRQGSRCFDTCVLCWRLHCFLL